MGITWEMTTITTCTRVCCERELEESINNTLKGKGSCDKPDLPWLLATYVGEERKKTQGERETERGHVKTAVSGEVKVQASRRKTTPGFIYTEQTFSKTWAGQQIQVILPEWKCGSWLLLSLLRPSVPHPVAQSHWKETAGIWSQTAIVHKRNKSYLNTVSQTEDFTAVDQKPLSQLCLLNTNMFYVIRVFAHIYYWTQIQIIALLADITFVLVWAEVKEKKANIAVGFDNCRVKWLIYNAASPVAFAQSIVAAQGHERGRENETQSKFMAQVSVKWSLPQKRKKHLQCSCEWSISHLNFNLQGYRSLTRCNLQSRSC